MIVEKKKKKKKKNPPQGGPCQNVWKKEENLTIERGGRGFNGGAGNRKIRKKRGGPACRKKKSTRTSECRKEGSFSPLAREEGKFFFGGVRMDLKKEYEEKSCSAYPEGARCRWESLSTNQQEGTEQVRPAKRKHRVPVIRTEKKVPSDRGPAAVREASSITKEERTGTEVLQGDLLLETRGVIFYGWEKKRCFPCGCSTTEQYRKGGGEM